MPEFILNFTEWLLDSPCLVYGGIGVGGLLLLAYIVVMEVGFCLENTKDWD